MTPLAALEGRGLDPGVGGRARHGQVVAQADVGRDSAARSGVATVGTLRGGMEAQQRAVVVGAGRLRPQSAVDRSAFRRDSPPTPAPPPPPRPIAAPASLPSGHGHRRATPSNALASSPSSSGRMTCASGSPKRALNSSTIGPCGGQHQPGVEHAAIRRPVARHPPGDRLEDLGHRRARARRRRTTAPGVARPCRRCSAGVPVAEPLVVAGRRQRDDRLVADQGEG